MVLPSSPTLEKRWKVDFRRLDAAQYALLLAGRQYRIDTQDSHISVLRGGLSRYCQERGVFIADVVEHSGLTRQTLSRLSRQYNTHRVRDLIAGTAALVAAGNRDRVAEHRGKQSGSSIVMGT